MKNEKCNITEYKAGVPAAANLARGLVLYAQIGQRHEYDIIPRWLGGHV